MTATRERHTIVYVGDVEERDAWLSEEQSKHKTSPRTDFRSNVPWGDVPEGVNIEREIEARQHALMVQRFKFDNKAKYLETVEAALRTTTRQASRFLSPIELGTFAIAFSVISTLAGLVGTKEDVMLTGAIGIIGGITFLLMGRA